MKIWLTFLLCFSVFVSFAAAKKENAKKSAPKAQKQTADKAVPAKPVVPEKKQPFELWMTAHTKALQAVKEKKYDEALALFDEAVKVADRGNFKNNSLYEKAGLLAELKRYDEALKVLQAPVSRGQNTSYHRFRCNFMCGEILMKKGDLDAAEKEFQKVTASEELNWVSAESIINLGRIAFLRKDEKKAVALFKSVLNNENFLPGLRARGVMAEAEMLKQLKRLPEACALLETLQKIEQLPAENLLDGIFMRSELMVEMKDLRGARILLNQSFTVPGKTNPYLAEIHTRIARILFMQKRYYDAQNSIRRARSVRGHQWGYDKELHKSIDQAVAKANQERKIRERKARIERERKARLERERKARAERERKARLERERKRIEQQKAKEAAKRQKAQKAAEKK